MELILDSCNQNAFIHAAAAAAHFETKILLRKMCTAFSPYIFEKKMVKTCPIFVATLFPFSQGRRLGGLSA